MKRLITIILAILTMVGTMAQDNKSWRQNRKPMSAKETTAYLTKELGLTNEQKQRVERLHEQYADLFKSPPSNGNHPQKDGKQPSQKPNNAPRESWRTDGNTSASPSQRMPPRDNSQNKDREKQWKSYKKGMKKILTGQQYKTYEKLMESRK